MRRWLYGGLLLMLLGNLLEHGSAAATESPQLVQRLITAISSMKQAANGQVTEAEGEEHHCCTDRQYDSRCTGVSQWTLGKRWEKLSPAEQQAFVQLLEQLFAKVAYPKSAEFFGELNIAMAGERITGQGAVVRTTVRHPKEDSLPSIIGSSSPMAAGVCVTLFLTM